VTETIWQSLYDNDKSTKLQHCEKHNKKQCTDCEKDAKSGVGLLISQQWPEKINYDKKKATEFEKIKELVSEIRARSVDLGGGKRKLYYVDSELVAENTEIIKFLGKLSGVEMGKGKGLRMANANAWLSASDQELSDYRDNLMVKLGGTKNQIKNLQSRLDNKSYVKNAPAKLVEQSSRELAEQQQVAEVIAKSLSDQQ
jgi:valyl-tRNA synthetase